MKIIPLLTATMFGLLALNPNSAEATSDSSELSIHEQCLKATDYVGCIKVKSNQEGSASTKNECDNNGWCVVAGNSQQGVPAGWWYKRVPNGSTIYQDRRTVKRIPHKGQDSRYVVYNTAVNYYQSPRASTTNTIGSAYTRCTSNSYTVNCTTTPPATYTTPGRPGGWRMTYRSLIVDCKDKTIAWHYNGRIRGKWRRSNKRFSTWLSETCYSAEILPVSSIKL